MLLTSPAPEWLWGSISNARLASSGRLTSNFPPSGIFTTDAKSTSPTVLGCTLFLAMSSGAMEAMPP